MSANQDTSPTSTPRPAAKPRNPVERLVVWGGILILLLLVGIEFASSRSQAAAVAKLTAKMRASETGDADVKAADVKAAVNGKTPRVLDVSDKNLRSGSKRAEVYDWFTLSPLKRREMYVYYGIGEDPDVLSVTMEEDTDIVVIRELTEEELVELKATLEAQNTGTESKSGDQPAKTPESSEPAEATPAETSPAKE
jgi:hypothetical protein